MNTQNLKVIGKKSVN